MKTQNILKKKKNQKKFDYQYTKVVKPESELNEKNKDIKDLENKNLEIINESNTFKNNIESEVRNLNKIVTSKENKWNTKLNKLNNDVKKLKNYIKENNDKKINKEKELGDAKDKYDRLLVEYNKSNEE